MFKNKKINYLISGLNKKSGRNSRGKITVYHKGGGNKINYRIIDFIEITIFCMTLVPWGLRHNRRND